MLPSWSPARREPTLRAMALGVQHPVIQRDGPLTLPAGGGDDVPSAQLGELHAPGSLRLVLGTLSHGSEVGRLAGGGQPSR